MDKNMAAFFDKLAPGWDNSPHDYEKREELTSMMSLSRNSIIADIGCGTGVMFEHLLKFNPEKIYAVDASGEMIRYAREKFTDSRIEYINDDFLCANLPLVDTAVIFNAYPHFLDKKALAEKLAHTLKKGGVFIIAHSAGKSKINGRHKGETVSKLSVPLESAETEAGKFLPYFSVESIIDNDEMYFVKLLNK